MLFNSLQFLIFFPTVILLYFILPHKYKWFLLLIASCIFYAAFIPAYLLILFAVVGIDYAAALAIEKAGGRKRKAYLLLSITVTCLLLFFFKYFNFFSANLGYVAQALHWNYTPAVLKYVLPIGLSFHTFQSLSYVIEVYRGNQKAEKHLGIYALYVMFFPQLVAGPIERPQNLLHQFHAKQSLSYTDVVAGLRLMLLGFFKKMVIADNLAAYVDEVYKNPAAFSGNLNLLAIVFFSIQIYCDFSGYSDIAIGSARIMGYKLMKNFDHPYRACSIGEFWRRWHISLSTWFRDYVYIPLGGNRGKKWKVYYNLFIVFILSGFWHGAGWNFLVWGGLHAVFLITEAIISKPSSHISSAIWWPSLRRATGWLVTFCLVTFAWIFFRAADIPNALQVINRISFHPASFISDCSTISARIQQVFPFRTPLPFVFVMLAAFLLLEQFVENIAGWPKFFRWIFYYATLAAILLFGVYDVTPNFIYFQF